MSNINDILERLDKVKSTGEGKWQALCPSHDDKTPSLSICDADGVVKIYCHACGANGIETIATIGGEVSWLFSEKKTPITPPTKKDNSALANELYKLGAGDCSEHPYIVAKGIKSPVGARRLKISGKRLLIGIPIDVDALIIPIYAGKNPKISSLQIIWKSGDKFEKRFLKDANKELGWFAYCAKWSKAEKIVICEGVATGQSLVECTGLTVICAYSSGELPKIYEFVRSINKSAQIYIAVDSDKAGREAGEKCKGAILVEPSDAPDKFDWNDEHTKRGGPDVVAAAFENAKFIEPVSAGFNKILDSDPIQTNLDLLSHLDADSLLARMVRHTSSKTWIPENTILLMGLAAFSSVSCRAYSVEYEFGGLLPIGIYAAAEQPPSMSKGWALSTFTDIFFENQTKAIQQIKARITALEETDSLLDEEKEELKHLKKQFVTLFVNNATPEGLDKTLNGTCGFFSAVSSEQGLIDSITGASYGNGRPNNNDIILHGFDGGYMSSVRATREAYAGRVAGAFVAFSQYGTIEKILNNGIGTGYSQRFLMISENNKLGERDHHKIVAPDPQLEYEYKRCCEFSIDALFRPKKLEDLRKLKITTHGFWYIREYRQKIEPLLSNKGYYSSDVMAGAAGKINMQIMKISANLHLLSSERFLDHIQDKTILTAIAIANDLLKELYNICKSKGIIGQRAEYSSILMLFENNQTPRTARNIIQAKLKNEPFKSLGINVNKSKYIRNILDEMVKNDVLKISYLVDKTEVFSVC